MAEERRQGQALPQQQEQVWSIADSPAVRLAQKIQQLDTTKHQKKPS